MQYLNWKIANKSSIRKSTQKMLCITSRKGLSRVRCFAFKIYFIFIATECRVSRIAIRTECIKKSGNPIHCTLLRHLSSSTLQIILLAVYLDYTHVSCWICFSTNNLCIGSFSRTEWRDILKYIRIFKLDSYDLILLSYQSYLIEEKNNDIRVFVN